LKLEVLFTKKFKVGTKIESSFEKWELTNICLNRDSLCLNLFYMPSCKTLDNMMKAYSILFACNITTSFAFGINMKSQTMWNEGNLSYIDMIVKKIGFNLWQFN
jgi:hypothetical protein